MISSLLLFLSFSARASELKSSAKVDSLDAQAIALLANGHTKEAARIFGRSIALDPMDARAYANRCTARYQFGDYSGAIADFEAATRLAPKLKSSLLALSMSDAHLQVGQRLIKEGKSDQAVERFYASVRLNRKNSAAYAAIARAALQRGDFESALSYFDRAIQLDPGEGGFYAGRAKANAALGRSEQASKDGRRAYELNANKQH